jgi:metal-sulfur cluster biosynthetic enzyme
MVTNEAVLSSLREVVDPEIGVNLVDLGLIREVQIEEGRIQVRMVLTAPGCPLAGYLMSQVRGRLEAIAQGAAVDVQLVDEVWKPGWA